MTLEQSERLRRLRRKSVFDPAIEKRGGRIVQTGGDLLLIVFDSIDGAVRCAANIQAARVRCENVVDHGHAARDVPEPGIGTEFPNCAELSFVLYRSSASVCSR